MLCIVSLFYDRDLLCVVCDVRVVGCWFVLLVVRCCRLQFVDGCCVLCVVSCVLYIWCCLLCVACRMACVAFCRLTIAIRDVDDCRLLVVRCVLYVVCRLLVIACCVVCSLLVVVVLIIDSCLLYGVRGAWCVA